jgi:hypothetical protein
VKIKMNLQVPKKVGWGGVGWGGFLEQIYSERERVLRWFKLPLSIVA